MANSFKLVAVLGLVASLSACGGGYDNNDEFVVVEPEPISVEPAYTGTYK